MRGNTDGGDPTSSRCGEFSPKWDGLPKPDGCIFYDVIEDTDTTYEELAAVETHWLIWLMVSILD